MKSKNIVVVVRGGMIEEVFSNDENVSITVIDADIHKQENGLSSNEINKLIAKETIGLTKVIQTSE